jgi:hypothetical protein
MISASIKNPSPQRTQHKTNPTSNDDEKPPTNTHENGSPGEICIKVYSI